MVGAGAIGGWIGARLAAQGAHLSVLARGATLAALRREGLRLSSQAGHELPAQTVLASDQAAELGPQDLVVIAVKAPALAQVASQMAPLLGPDTVILTAMNGVPWWFLEGGPWAGQRLESVDPGGHIAHALPIHQVLGCVVHASCAVTAPAHIHHHFGNGLIVGETKDGASDRARALVQQLCAAGFQATVSERIQQDIWYKLWGNMTVNPISALTGATTDRIMDDELVRGFISAIMLEAKAIGAELGLPIAQNPEDRHAVTRKLGAFRTSMLQDVEAGKPIELDALVTAVRELGQTTHIPTPYTDALLGLARLHARERGLYPF
ncbi:MAG: hypothetical protein RLZZ612_1195 [Pseudomonadota bacterium]|jgi:2-dehydropantoate 2-reductase